MSDNAIILMGVAGAVYYYFVMNKKEDQANVTATTQALDNGVADSSNENHDYKGNVIPEHRQFHTMPVESTPQSQPKTATM